MFVSVALLAAAAPGLVFCGDLGRARIHLRVEGAGAKASAVELIVRPSTATGAPGKGEIRRIPVDPRLLRVDVDLPSGRWSVSPIAQGFWAQEKTLDVDVGNDSTATLTLWPSGTIEGMLSPPGAAPDLWIAFTPTSMEKRAPKGEIRCPIEHGRLACSLPAGVFDLRLAARGFVPFYRWGVRVPKGGIQGIGELTVMPGASISGFVSAPTTSAASCTVEPLTPEGGVVIPPRPGSPHSPGAGYSSPTNDHGFFQLKAIPPGLYTVRAVCHNRRSNTVSVRVEKDAESRLSGPILLGEPVFMDIGVNPPASATGRPWVVLVQSLADLAGESAVRKEVPADGWVRFDDLSPGDYLVSVEAGDGERWFSDEVHVEPPSGRLEVKLEGVKLVGTISLGSQPLRATLFFGGENGATRIPIESDEAGIFTGFLPNDHDARWLLDVRAESPPVLKHLEVDIRRDASTGDATVEVVLAESTLRGIVVDETGQPMERAIVRIQPLKENEGGVDRWITLRADADGRFETAGLAPGRVSITAEAGDATADPQEVAVSRNPRDVRLVVRRGLRISGRVVSGDTEEPVPGALVMAAGLGPTRMRPTRTQTDAEGNFTLAGIARGTSAVDIAIGAAGYVSQFQRGPISRESLTVVLRKTGGGSIRLAFSGDGWNPRNMNLPAPVLFYGDSAVPIVWMFPLAALNGVVNGDPKLFVLPQMPAGPYNVCVMSYLDQFRGVVPRPSDCVSGDLLDGGVLDWTVKPDAR